MKKLLTLALTALLGWSSAFAYTGRSVVMKGTVQPTTSLVDGGKYILYDAAKANGAADNTRALRRVAEGATAITGYGMTSFPTSGSYLYDEVVFQAIAVKNASGAVTGWQFKHLGTDKFIEARTGNGNVNLSATAGTYELTLNSGYSAFQVKCTGTNQSWDGQSGSYPMVSWSANGSDGDTHFYRFYSLDDENMEVYDQEVTATFRTSATDANAYTKTVYCSREHAPVLPGFTCSNPNITEGVDLVYTLNDWQEFRVYNERQNKYMRVNGDNDNQTLGQIQTDNPLERTVFYKAKANDDGGFIIYYPAGKAVVGPTLGTQATTKLLDVTKPGQIYYTGKQEAPADYMDWIGEVKGTEDNKANVYKFFNDLGGSGVCGFLWPDGGSRWIIVTNLSKFKENWELRRQLIAAIPNYNTALETIGEEDTDHLAEWAAAYNFGGNVNVDVTPENMVKINKILNATIHADIIVTKRKAQKLIALGGVKQTAVTAWNNAVTVAGDNISAAVLASLNEAYANLGKGFGGFSVNIQSGKVNDDGQPSALVDYISANNNGGTWEPRRFNGGVGTRAWTLIPVSETNLEGFYLFNEYTNKYFKHPVETDHNGFLVENRADASTYMLDVYLAEDPNNDNKTKFGIKTLDTNPVGGHSYLHSNGSNDIVPWNPCHPSSWYISVVSEDVAATEHLNGAVAIAGGFDVSKVGTGIGYYTANDTEAYGAAKVAAVAAQAEGTEAADRIAAADALWAAFRTMNPTIITPEAGRYYRIKNKASGKYIHNVADSGRLPLGDNSNANHVKTIWMFDGTRLIAYPSGLVLGKFGMGDTANSWGLCNEGSDADHSGTVSFQEGATVGSLLISASPNRHIEGSGEQVNVGGAATEAYSWTFEAVDWLPVHESTANPYKTFISSEELLGATDRYHAYEVKIEGGKVVYDEITGNIPAGKPVLLIENAGSTKDATNHYVYMHVNHDATAATTVTVNGALKGSFKAGVKAEGEKYYALNSEFKFVETEGDETEGFVAYIEPGEDAEEEYEIALTVHGSTFEESAVELANNSNHTVTLTHSVKLMANPAVTEPIVISEYKPEETEPGHEQVATMRRVSTMDDGSISVSNSDFEYSGTSAKVDLGTRLAKNSYELTVPEGFFLADGKATPAHSYTFSVNSDGSTSGINEVMKGMSEGAIYDLQGRRLAAPVKGLNIIGGQKVLVK